MIGSNVLRAHPNDAWSISLAVGQKNAEIQIVRENHTAVVARPLHDFGVRCVVSTNGRPMNPIKTALAQKRKPVGRQIHVDEDSHATAKGTSNSSTRHAA